MRTPRSLLLLTASLTGLLMSAAVVWAWPPPDHDVDERPPPEQVDSPPDGPQDELGDERPDDDPDARPRRPFGRPFRPRGMMPGGPGSGPGGPGPGGRDGPPPMRMTPEQIEVFLKFVETHFPEMGRRLRTLQKENPEDFQRSIRRLAPRLALLREAYERDPNGMGKLLIEDHKLEQEIREQAREYRRERDEARRKKSGDELRQLIEKQWAVRLERRKLELADLEKQLAEVRKRVTAYEGRKSDLIERQFRRVTGEDDVDF